MTEAKRLAFWGRVSTEDNQDIESSRGWQLTRARTLIEPRGGQIVADQFAPDSLGSGRGRDQRRFDVRTQSS